MSASIKTLTVHLEEGTREEYADALAAAIRCFGQVTRVEPVVATLQDRWAVAEARRQIRERLWDLLNEVDR